MNITYNSTLINSETEKYPIIALIWCVVMLLLCCCGCVYIPKWSIPPIKLNQ